jgi:hypothetical protein
MAGAAFFEAKYSVPRILLRVGGALLFITFGLFLTGILGERGAVRDSSSSSVAIGALSIVIFGYLGVFYLRLLFKDRPSFRIDSTGLLDRNVSDLTIPWEHISDIRIRQVRHRRSGITLFTGEYIDYMIDPAFERKLTGFDRLIRQPLGAFNRGRPTILYQTLDCDLDMLTWALRTIPPEHARLIEA